MHNGIYVAVEGIDGSGKTSFIKRLSEVFHEALLDEDELVITQAPRGTDVGKAIYFSVLNQFGKDGMGKDTLKLLFLATHAEHAEKVIRPALAEKKIIISDRSIETTIVYQDYSTDDNMLTRMMGHKDNPFVEPDVVFLLDIDPSVAQARMNQRSISHDDKMDSAEMDFHQRNRTAFLDRAHKLHTTYFILDATRSITELADYAYGKIIDHHHYKSTQLKIA